MDMSIFLAKAFSIYFLVFGVAILVRRKKFQEVYLGFFADKASYLIAAVIALILGILLVLVHPYFTADWRSVITVFAWLTLIKGIVLVFMPDWMVGMQKRILTKAPFYYIAGIVCVLLALCLGYHGFVV